MSKLNKNDSVIATGRVYKPLISASLALALGVSVASAAAPAQTGVITSSATTGAIDIADAQAVTNTDGTAKGGLVFEAVDAPATVALTGQVSIAAIDGGGNKNAYSILIDSANKQNVGFSASSAQSILVTALPANATATTGEMYVFANKSANTVTFDKVNLTVNASAVSNQGTFGLYTGIDGAKYDFGSATGAKTVFTGITNETANTTSGQAGDAATGIIVADNATIAGNLEFASFAGQDAQQANATATAGKGGDTYGISGENGKTLTLVENSVITFKELKGGKGEFGQNAASSVSGAGGDVAGIYLADTKGLTISGGGRIVFEKLTVGTAGTAGSGGTAGNNGVAYVINNKSTTTALTITDTSIIAQTPAPSGETTRAAAEAEGAIAIVSKIADVNYAFGSNTGKTVLSRTAAGNDVAGVKFTGIEIGANATLGGNLEVIGQDGGAASNNKGGQNGGDAVGILLSSGTLTSDSLVLSVTGGAGTGKQGTPPAGEDRIGEGGAATGIVATGDTGAKIAGSLRINLVSGQDGDSSTRDATLTAIDNQMTGATGILTFNSGSSLAVKGSAATSDVYGISNEIADIIYNFGSGEAKTVFTAVGDKTANSANSGAAGNDATGLNLVNSAKIKGNVEFAKIQGQDGEAKTATGSDTGGDGGSAYGIKFVANQSLTLENANVVFKNLVAGEGGASDTKGANGKNIGIDIAASSTSTISGSGKIVFEGFDKADAPIRGVKTGATENTIINNAGTKLTLSGISIDAKGSTTITDANYAIYNGIAGTQYAFGTETVLENYAQGMILADSSLLKGKLNVTNALEAGTQENNNVGQENVTGLVIRGGTHDTKSLELKVGSTNGNVTAIRLEGNIPVLNPEARDVVATAEMELGDAITFATGSLSAKSDINNKIVALENIGNSRLIGAISLADDAFVGNAQKIILDNKGALELASSRTFLLDNGASASEANNFYGIFAGIDGAQFNFGTSTSFTGIADTTAANAGTLGKDTAAIYAAANLTLSGNASFENFAGQVSKDQAALGDGANGGNAYGVTTAGADAVIAFDNAKLTFANLTGGTGGASYTGGTGGQKSGDAAGIYINAHNLTLQGSGSIIFGGTISGGAAKTATANNMAVKEGNAYIIQNASTTDKALTLSGVSVIAGSLPTTGAPTTGSYGIYNKFADSTEATYAFGELSTGGTILNNGAASANTAGSDFTGMIVGSDVYAFGVLKVVGQDADGQEQAARAAGDGLKGGDVVGIELAGGEFKFDTLTLDVAGGAGSDKDVAGTTAGNGGDAYGIKATSANSTITLAKGASVIKVAGGAAAGVDGAQGNAYGIYTEGALNISGITAANTLSLDVEGNNAFGLYLGGDKTADTAKIVAILGGDLAIVGNSSTGAIQGANAYGIYNAGNNSFTGNVVFGDASSNVAIGSDSATAAYGLYNAGVLTLSTSSIGFEAGALAVKTSNGTSAHLYNAGDLTFENGAKVFARTAVGDANISAGDNSTLNIVLAEGSTTTFGAATAIDASTTSGVVNITMGAGAQAVFKQAAFGATGGEINLALNSATKDGTTTGAKLVFNGGAGDINTLSGSNADILLAGADRESILARINSADTPFKGRVLQVADMKLNDSSFVLAAKSTAVDRGAINSDQVVINGSTAITTPETPINNTLYIVVDDYTKNSENVATLATVDSSAANSVIFNGMKTDGEVDSTVYSGFTTAEVKIKRTTDGNGDVAYTSTLESGNIQVNTDFVAPTTAALSAGVSLFSANLNSLSKRMGELRFNPYSHGVWARVFGGEQTTNFGAKQSTVYSTIQAGYDYKLDLGNAANYIGVAVSYTKGMGGQVDPVVKYAPAPLNTPIAGLSSSNTDGVEVAVYNSYVAESGLYSDSIVKFGYFMSDLTMFGQTDTYSTSNIALAVSEEVGYKFKLGEQNEWFITPQGEVAFAYMGGTEFTQNLGGNTMKSTQDAVSLLRARVGAAWGYDFSHFAKESDVKASVYLGTYYTYDYFIGGDTTLSTTASGKLVDYTHNAYEGTGRFVMNLGTNIDVQDRTKVYFDFEKSFGGNIQTDYQVSLGVRFGLGEKASAPKQEKKANEVSLKPKELDDTSAENEATE